MKNTIKWLVNLLFLLLITIAILFSIKHNVLKTSSDEEVLADLQLEKEMVAPNHEVDLIVPKETKHAHVYIEEIIEPTCTTDGYTNYICECGDSYVGVNTAKLGHDYDATIVEPTCTSEGYTTYLCECGDTYIDNKTPIIEHQYEVTNSVVATCTNEGYTKYQCAVCGDSYNDDFTAILSHDYDAKVVAPTTESQGYTKHTCSVCGDSYKDSYVDKLPIVIYTEVDEYLYVTAETLNVRTGPGTSYEKVKSLPQNTKVHRVAKGDNNWSKIEIDGKIFYVSSNYLSKNKVEQPKQETVAEEMARRGNIGRLRIPSVGVDVALFKSSVYGGSQPVVDANDSAAYMADAVDCYGQILIGDHRHQGFDKIKKSSPGSTKAYFDFGTYTKTYVCTDKFVGKNIGYDLVDLNGTSITGRNDGGVCMYTCNTDGTVTITFWQPT